MNERVTIDSGVALRDTVADIVRKRDLALELYGQAHKALGLLSAAVNAAHEARRAASPMKLDSYNVHLKEEESRFLHAFKIPDRDFYLAQARKITDANVWSHIIGFTDLERLMDKKAKDQFRQQLLTDPPPADVETITATLESFMADSPMIFRRGIAECFSKLSRRFRSHDGFKIGARVILDNAFSGHGGWSYGRNHQDTFRDIERTFMTLDGKRMPESYASIVALVESNRSGHKSQQSFVENDYFRVRCFLNGNAHIWFKRKDLMRKVNRMLGEYYGEVVPDARDDRAEEAADDAALNTPKTELAKNYGFFPTPDSLAEKIMEEFPLSREKDKPALRVLEPNAGTGNFARLCFTKPIIPRMGAFEHDRKHAARHNATHRFDNEITCIEIQPALADALRDTGLYAAVHCCDFLKLQPESTGLYDRIIMNPPFDRERDIDHVMHALKFLAPDGYLVAIMSAGTGQRETRKSIAFRKLIESKGGEVRDLPDNSFASVGTNVNTIVVKFWNNGSKRYSSTRW